MARARFATPPLFCAFWVLFQPPSLLVRGSEAIARDCRTRFLDSFSKGFCWVQPRTRQPRGDSSPVRMSKYPVINSSKGPAATSTPRCVRRLHFAILPLYTSKYVLCSSLATGLKLLARRRNRKEGVEQLCYHIVSLQQRFHHGSPIGRSKFLKVGEKRKEGEKLVEGYEFDLVTWSLNL